MAFQGTGVHMRSAIGFLLLLATASAGAASVTLYDAGTGALPGAQGWFNISNGTPVLGHDGSATTLDTTAASGIQAGYFSEPPPGDFGGLFEHPLMPVLDTSAGFRISFDLQVLAETHASRDDNGDGLFDRAGFSVIVITQNLLGIELGFFTDRVWAYEDGQADAGDLFTQAEGAAYATTAMTRYSLFGTSSGYGLFADGIGILSGNWRDYNPNGLDALINPYDNPSFLFFGDNTTSAASSVRLGDIRVAPVPLPPAVLLAMLPTSLLLLRRRRD